MHGLLGTFEGTAAAGQTGALEDLGSFVVKRGQRQIGNARVADVVLMNDIRFGSNIFSSVEAGAFEASFFIPFYESDRDDVDFQNALAITGDSELNFEWVPGGAINTVFDSISLKLYSELAAYDERYEYNILRDDQIESGSVSGKPYQINKDNVSALYLQDPDDVVDLIQLEQNGRSVFSPQPWLTLLAGTLRDNRLETDTFSMVMLECYTAGNFPSVVNRDSVLSVTTSGAGTLRVLTTNLKIWDQPR